MSDPNTSLPSESYFIIVGVPGLQEHYTTLFLIFLILFLATMLGNLLIIVLVSLDPRLHTPMYFFLWNLAVLDVLLTITITPKLLAVFLGHNRISFTGCFLQMYFYVSISASEVFLVGAMAYDRYVAVVKPLHYNTIINTKACLMMTATVWAVGFLIPLVSLILASSVPFCTSNHVLHVVCEYPSVMSLACADVTAQVNFALLIAMGSVWGPFLFVLWSYSRIIVSVVKMKTVESRKKAFYMCSSHMLVVVLYYVSTSMVYIALRVDSIPPNGRIFIGGLNYFLTPLVNPLIYSLRNEKIKAAAQRYFGLKSAFPHSARNTVRVVK
ncbi:olfactory receptor 2AT4-like [Amia ocellicauda]|uniref:olfactory receptor 2AT4-like n=1 Tax=Amia ocellicauda TaxID=2972642 RepID=UPI003463BF20